MDTKFKINESINKELILNENNDNNSNDDNDNNSSDDSDYDQEFTLKTVIQHKA